MKFDLFFPLLPVLLVSYPGNNHQPRIIKTFPSLSALGGRRVPEQSQCDCSVWDSLRTCGEGPCPRSCTLEDLSMKLNLRIVAVSQLIGDKQMWCLYTQKDRKTSAEGRCSVPPTSQWDWSHSQQLGGREFAWGTHTELPIWLVGHGPYCVKHTHLEQLSCKPEWGVDGLPCRLDGAVKQHTWRGAWEPWWDAHGNIFIN